MKSININRIVIVGGILAGIITVSFFILPVISLLLRCSPGIILSSVQDPFIIHAIILSLGTAFITTVVIVLFGTPLAYIQARKEYPGKDIVETILDIPIILPPAVAGIALLLLFGKKGILGFFLSEIGIQVLFTVTAIILAQLFVAGPLYVRQAKNAIVMVPVVYDQAGRTLGASSFQIIIKIILPLARKGILSGIMLTYARAVGEFGATMMIAGNIPGKTQTMPVAIYSLLQTDMDGAISIAVILVWITVIILVMVRVLSDRRQVC
jgi:molybdate transport system permease protein